MMNYVGIILALALSMPLFSMEEAGQREKNVTSPRNPRPSQPKQIHFAEPCPDGPVLGSSPRKELLRAKEVIRSTQVQKGRAVGEEKAATGPESGPSLLMDSANKRTSFANSDGLLAALIASEAAAITSEASPKGERLSARNSHTFIIHDTLEKDKKATQSPRSSEELPAGFLKTNTLSEKSAQEPTIPEEHVNDDELYQKLAQVRIKEAKEALSENKDDELHRNAAQVRSIQEVKEALAQGKMAEFSRAFSTITDETEKVLLLHGAFLIYQGDREKEPEIIRLAGSLKDGQAKTELAHLLQKSAAEAIKRAASSRSIE